ncbi:13674_t:CDS:2 [Ambispora leptoticha]|uniref:13674_t:CDS:1 n=1 Tax=Ambispora leptoticha TaxID=144679 RepID=A0A9N9GC34_9GLOM|nr:13674_t:CDS:2 [Ambispora leptoticha]
MEEEIIDFDLLVTLEKLSSTAPHKKRNLLSSNDNNSTDSSNELINQVEMNIEDISSLYSSSPVSLSSQYIKRKHKVITTSTSPIKTPSKPKKQTYSLEVADYYLEGGLRKVKPYYFEFQAYAKGRWIGKSISDVFCTEFRDQSPEYYKSAIRKGLITINGNHVSAETIIRNQDIIGHKIHRHEPPVTGQPIAILKVDNDGVLVIDKPASIPVHPTGRYRHNTILHILRIEHGFTNLFPVNRLDRLTSGVMILALSKSKAQELEKQMRDKTIRKEYICRVVGKFPDGEIICDKPIRVISQKLGLNMVHPDGKSCTTVFERISYNGRTSVVRCKPLTGRTHQIRVHLQYLGHPIANDPLYASTKIWGENLGKEGVIQDSELTKEIMEKLAMEGQNETLDHEEAGQIIVMFKEENNRNNEIIDIVNANSSVISRTNNHDSTSSHNQQKETKKSSSFYECGCTKYPDPLPPQLLIWLHALKYQGIDWEYESNWPAWANKDFSEDEAYF